MKDDERAHLIKELGRAGGPDAALGAFEALLAASAPTGLGPSVYHATLSACATNFSSEKAMRVFRAMQEAGSVGSVASYNMLIAALSQAGKVPEAFKVYEQLIDEGLEPNSFTFNMLIQGCTFKRRGLYKCVLGLNVCMYILCLYIFFLPARPLLSSPTMDRSIDRNSSLELSIVASVHHSITLSIPGRPSRSTNGVRTRTSR